jgi:hypothetical protein
MHFVKKEHDNGLVEIYILGYLSGLGSYFSHFRGIHINWEYYFGHQLVPDELSNTSYTKHFFHGIGHKLKKRL